MKRKFALLIANCNYLDESLPRLDAPLRDVKGLSGVLSDPTIGGFHDVKSLIDERREIVEAAIESFLADRHPDDLLLLYFSGHGMRHENDGRLYLGVKDTQRSRLRSTAVKSAFVTELMDESRSQKQVLVLDCCYSGAFAAGMKASLETSVGTGAAFQGNASGRIVLTASDSTQFAWEGNKILGHLDDSLFTHFLIEGLRTGGADFDGAGTITVDNWFRFARDHVVGTTSRQRPLMWSYKTEGSIVLADVPLHLLTSWSLPADIRAAINSPLRGVREGVISDLADLARSPDPRLAAACVAALKELLKDDSESIRRIAEIALRDLGGAEGSPSHSPLGFVAGDDFPAEKRHSGYSPSERSPLASDYSESESLDRRAAEESASANLSPGLSRSDVASAISTNERIVTRESLGDSKSEGKLIGRGYKSHLTLVALVTASLLSFGWWYFRPHKPGTPVSTGIAVPDGKQITAPAPKPAQAVPTIESFTSERGSVLEGEAIRLTWKVEGAKSLSIDNGIGDVTGQTSILSPPLKKTTTFQLKAVSESGTSNQNAKVVAYKTGYVGGLLVFPELTGVLFSHNSAAIDSDYSKSLETDAKRLKDVLPKCRSQVVILSMTMDGTTQKQRRALSRERGLAVADRLVALGVPEALVFVSLNPTAQSPRDAETNQAYISMADDCGLDHK